MALYGRRAGRWSLTERGRSALARTADSLAIGPSSLAWENGGLTAELNEVTAPVPSRIRGTLRVEPASVVATEFMIDGAGLHRWRPLAPLARVEVAFSAPEFRWSGHGYFDSNCGDEPLGRAFAAWEWSRATIGQRAAVLYDTRLRDGGAVGLALAFDRDGRIEPFAPPRAVALPPTRWGIPRRTRADPETDPAVVRTLTDAPFYARSLVETRLLGAQTRAIHESLSLDRFGKLWVKLMLPFRMPRRSR